MITIAELTDKTIFFEVAIAATTEARLIHAGVCHMAHSLTSGAFLDGRRALVFHGDSGIRAMGLLDICQTFLECMTDILTV